ncbi:hypothetical protein [Algibacter sp. Ld11]|uniref:hypothetical protein n=1 Tax=Algibacter sp. Ld11 TaxID=649150 RepID=UPI00386FF2EC
MSEILFWINLGVQVLVGVVLVFVIRHKNSQIETLKTNFSTLESMMKLYNVDDFKKNVELKLENQQLQHQREIEKAFKHSEETIKQSILRISSPWLIKYDELLNYQVHFLSRMEENELKKALKLLPTNEKFILKLLKDIENGNLKPKN